MKAAPRPRTQSVAAGGGSTSALQSQPAPAAIQRLASAASGGRSAGRSAAGSCGHTASGASTIAQR